MAVRLEAGATKKAADPGHADAWDRMIRLGAPEFGVADRPAAMTADRQDAGARLPGDHGKPDE